MAKYVLIFIIFIGVISFFCCNDKSLLDPVTVVSGIVTDSITGEPIDSAILCYNDTIECISYVYSDSAGYYYFSQGWGYIDMTLFCSKEGYYSKSVSINSTKFKHIFENINFELTLIQ